MKRRPSIKQHQLIVIAVLIQSPLPTKPALGHLVCPFWGYARRSGKREDRERETLGLLHLVIWSVSDAESRNIHFTPRNHIEK